jgi:hypothetical protein
MVFIVPLVFIILWFIIIYAKKKIWWVISLILFVLLMWLLIPSSYDIANTIAVKALASLIIVPFIIFSRFFTRLHQRRGIEILKDNMKRK